MATHCRGLQRGERAAEEISERGLPMKLIQGMSNINLKNIYITNDPFVLVVRDSQTFEGSSLCLEKLYPALILPMCKSFW